MAYKNWLILVALPFTLVSGCATPMESFDQRAEAANVAQRCERADEARESVALLILDERAPEGDFFMIASGLDAAAEEEAGKVLAALAAKSSLYGDDRWLEGEERGTSAAALSSRQHSRMPPLAWRASPDGRWWAVRVVSHRSDAELAAVQRVDWYGKSVPVVAEREAQWKGDQRR